MDLRSPHLQQYFISSRSAGGQDGPGSSSFLLMSSMTTSPATAAATAPSLSSISFFLSFIYHRSSNLPRARVLLILLPGVNQLVHHPHVRAGLSHKKNYHGVIMEYSPTRAVTLSHRRTTLDRPQHRYNLASFHPSYGLVFLIRHCTSSSQPDTLRSLQTPNSVYPRCRRLLVLFRNTCRNIP